MSGKDKSPQWKKIKNKVKQGYKNAKIKWGEIKSEMEQTSSKKTYNDYGKKNTEYNNKTSKLLNLKCPICGSRVPEELIDKFTSHSSIICEKCGYQINLNEDL